MFKTILLLHSCIFLLVKSNPLQGLPSYPVIQYQEDYRNQLPIFVQPSDFNTYPHLHLIQNQLTPYQSIPISYNDYVQPNYLDNILRNGLKSAVYENCVQNGGPIQQYVNPTDIPVPNVINNYIIVPVQTNTNNNTKDCRKITRTKTRDDGISTINENDDQKKNRKCRKRKNTSKNTNDKGHENTGKCSCDKKINRGEKESEANKQSSDQDIKVCRKKKSRNKSQTLERSTEKESSVHNNKREKDNNSNLKLENNKNANMKNCNKIEKACKSIDSENDIRETSKRVKIDKRTSNYCKKEIRNDYSCDFDRTRDLDDLFNINEDCTELDIRCTRNNREDNTQNYQQQYYPPSDFSSNMSPYNMMFNQKSFNTNGYFPFDFDYLYNMQRFPNENMNPPRKKPKIITRTFRRKKQKKGNKKNCNRNKQNTQQNGSCEKNLELLPTVVDVATGHECDSLKPAKIVETITEKTQDDPDIDREETDIQLSSHEDLKEIAPHDCFDWNHEDHSPVYNDYYPVFHSDNVYTSEEEFYWNNFNDRHYYSCSDMSEQDKDIKKYDSTDNGPVTQQDNIIKPNDIKTFVYSKKGKENNEKVNSKEENDNTKLKTSSEEIQFKSPPALDFPDFKTEMINKENRSPKIEIYYEPNDKAINKFENSKMSSYSNTKKAESNEKRSKVVDQNDVETVFGHSKVVKYGAPPNNVDLSSDIINGSDDRDKEDNYPHPSAEKTTIVIAQSLPYPY
ncbi:MATH and LRR domain-containing protein PFE0570w-like [Maniola jurtina]|uniref:MATH and LRR domain-containing protein PFE0570w-like n=1 Tax=Maniola jurtina TaxID=191418 RepID=UPI001E686A5C|nr:MATH and LRR domain-containing protein PFE0570w-like [Maniola jurtina]